MKLDRFYCHTLLPIVRSKITLKKQFVANNQLLELKMRWNLIARLCSCSGLMLVHCWSHVCSAQHSSYSYSHNRHQCGEYKTEYNATIPWSLKRDLLTFQDEAIFSYPSLFCYPCWHVSQLDREISAAVTTSKLRLIRTDIPVNNPGFLEPCIFFHTQQGTEHIQPLLKL